MATARQVSIVVPTYNEKENLENLLERIDNALKNTPHRFTVLIVDDHSPDGTGDLAERLKSRWPWLNVLHRTKRRGRGSAGVAGFMQALSEGAEWIVEMDADLSHDPAHLPQLLQAMESADVAIGSRFVPGGADLDRPWSRKIITRLAGLYVRSLLKLKMRDVSSGYRCFSRKVLEAIDMEDMISTGPSVVLEMIYKVAVKGFEIKEVPILFRDRRQGNTKLDTVTLLETLVMVLRLRKMRKAGRI